MIRKNIHVKSTFIGRAEELSRLESLARSSRSSLVVIKGRRRIGKSRLVAEFARDKVFLSFSGLSPTEGVTAQHQRDLFAYKLSSFFGQEFSEVTGKWQSPRDFIFSDWLEGFDRLAKFIGDKETVILFDEISWMGSKDPTFLPKLKVWWDQISEQHTNIVLVLCGSVSMWIEENILKSTAFFGRVSLNLTLMPLSLSESHQLLKQRGMQASNYDILRILAITGGIPWYIENFQTDQSIDENIKRFCFSPHGLLVQEFNMIFHDLFKRQGDVYKKIVTMLAEGMRDYTEIREGLGYPEGGGVTPYLDALITCGYVSKHQSWSLKTGKLVVKNLFRLSDNYLRFYLRVIDPILAKINRNAYRAIPLSTIPGWGSIMGLQIENLLLGNRELILKTIGIHPQDIVADNPFIKRPTASHEGVQVDYLIQTKTNTLYLCEFKFRRAEVGPEVIRAVEQKIRNLEIPRSLYVCPVLLHFGGVSDKVIDAQYFYRIIDINEFLG